MRTFLNLEKHHIEILLQLVEEELANTTAWGPEWDLDRLVASVRYLEVLLKETLEEFAGGM
jgi:hypothetical protein|tara:strand:- start:342 stop:524 length:183 start_codon:yes stop_codon:yes gene_type:complete